MKIINVYIFFYSINLVLIVHNEDGAEADLNHTILLHMHIVDNNKNTLSEYTSYVYAGQLATSGKIVNFDFK